ncbi:MAG: protein kinase [Nannocystis sp.]|nr:protein kinase [Nannocystis sp.]
MADAIALHPRGPDLRGRTLHGRFRLDGLIAPGGMADVYEALDLRLRRRVAIKALHPEHGRAPDQRRRFYQEAVLAAQIDHPHVIPIFDHGEEPALGGEPVLFLVMPLLQGVTLRQRLLEPAMPIADALSLTIQLLDGLAELHKLGAVHRDLKPENCLIVQRHGRDHLILLDLGLAKNPHRPAALHRALLGPRRPDRHARLRLPRAGARAAAHSGRRHLRRRRDLVRAAHPACTVPRHEGPRGAQRPRE